MTLQQIKDAVNAGKTVHWVNSAYRVTRDDLGQWFITYRQATWIGNCIGLTHRDGVTVNGAPNQFYVA